MNTLCRTVVCSLTLTCAAIAQTNPSPASASIGTNEYQRSDVVTLSDDTRVEIAPSGNFTATFHTRAKILTPRGRRYAEVPIPFNSKHQEIDFHFAKTIQPDGSEHSVKPEEINTASMFPGNPAYGDVQISRYIIRGADVGSILDQEYALKATPVMGNQFWMIWRLRSAQPVLQRTLIVRVPTSRKLQWRMHNVDRQPQITDSDDKQWKIYTWTYSAPTEITGEPYMPPPDEFMPWLEMTTVESWDDVATWLEQMSEPQIDTNEDIQSRVRMLTSTSPAPADKVAAIYYWLEDHFRFVSAELGMSSYKPRAASQTFLSRYGDAKDLSVLLTAMLRDAGIKARLAFLESGSARKISDRLPMARVLTHCIVVVEADGKTYYLDPTAETARFDVVLGRLCNTELLLIGKGANKLIPSPAYDGSKHGTREQVKMQLAADGSIKGDTKTEYLGESDAFIRAAFKAVPAEKVAQLMQRQVEQNMPRGILVDYEVADVSDRTRNFVTQHRFASPAWATVAGGAIRFKPQLPQKIELGDEMFGTGDRQFPFLFFETAPSTTEAEITLPDGFTVESLPKDLVLENSFSCWKRSIKQEGNLLIISETSYLKTAHLPKESFAEIRKYYEEAVARKNDEIVLKAK